MLTGLIGPTAADRAMVELFEDVALIEAALDFEMALARASAAEGVLSPAERDAIVRVGQTLRLDTEALVAEAQHSGTLAIPLVARLREAVAEVSADAAAKVHLGSTSQDLADTVCVLQCRRATELLGSAGWKLCDRLVEMAEQEAGTIMLGRTLLRGALPITFGLKTANWLTGLADGLARLEADAKALGLQLGGAVGTLVGFGGRGVAVTRRVAAELGLPEPELPWHARRNGTVALATSLAITAGALAKIARDVALLGQDEIGEAFERQPPGRGGSSAMPHKRNATGSQQALTAAGRVPTLAHMLLAGMAQEHERGFGGWQAELGALAEMFTWTFDAMLRMTGVMEVLEVDPAAMRRNLLAAGVGEDYGEAEALVSRAIGSYRRRRG